MSEIFNFRALQKPLVSDSYQNLLNFEVIKNPKKQEGFLDSPEPAEK